SGQFSQPDSQLSNVENLGVTNGLFTLGNALSVQNVSISGGTLAISEDGSLNGSGALVQSGGQLSIDSGSLAVTGTFTQSAGAVHLNLGTISALAGLTIEAPASFFGTGTINGNVTNRGILSIGDVPGPGTLTINGSFTQVSGAILKMDISGSWGYAQPAINVAANLDGMLQVALENGYVPDVGDVYSLLPFYSLPGQFNFLDLPALSWGPWAPRHNAPPGTFSLWVV